MLRLRQSVLKQMKALAPRGSRNRQLLTDGYIVIRARRCAKSDFFGDDSSDEDISYVWLHIAFVLLSPYVPVFQPMDAIRIEDGDIVPDGREVELKAFPT